MSANFIGDNSTLAAVQQFLLDVIETQMNQDLVLTGAVESTFFIGEQPAVVVTPPPTRAPSTLIPTPSTLIPTPSTAQPTTLQPSPIPVLPAPAPVTDPLSPTNSSNSTAMLASSLSAAAAIIVLAFAVLLGTRRKRRSDSSRKISIISEVDELEHVETGSSHHSSEYHDGDESKSPLPSPNNSAPLTLPELLADTLADADRSVMTDGTVASGEAVTILSAGEVTVTSGGDTTVVSGSSGDSDKAIGENMDVHGGDDKTLELPPKPPQGPSKQPPPVQQTLAKRRRKKKRKKKKNPAMIPHVSSRENIKAMETITEDNCEEADEGSDDEDCSDSEYSYETDESGSRSRDPSPIRSDGGSSELYPPAV